MPIITRRAIPKKRVLRVVGAFGAVLMMIPESANVMMCGIFVHGVQETMLSLLINVGQNVARDNAEAKPPAGVTIILFSS